MGATHESPGTPAPAICPSCGAPIESDPLYVTWCPHCDWNVRPLTPPAPRTLMGNLYAGMGLRLGRSLFETLSHAPTLRPTITLSLVLALLFALVVHAVTFGCAALGLFLLVFHWHNVFALILGLVLITTTVILVPRPAPFPEQHLEREQWPALFGAVDVIASGIAAPQPDAIVLTTEWNASFGHAGWRRRHVLRLGLPLLTILDEPQTAALIAHELAHAVNGDASRGFFIGSAIGTLSRWYRLLVPDEFSRKAYRYRNIALAAMFANLILHGLAALVQGVTSVLSHLLWQDSQRAEYLADSLAASVAGTAAMLSLLDALSLEPYFTSAVRRATLSPESGSLFSELRERVAALPERERERMRRVMRLEETRLDATHPPTGLRIALLEARPVVMPKRVLSALQWRGLHDELSRAEQGAQRRLVDGYRARLYY